MMTSEMAKGFETLIAWQKARALAIAVYQHTRRGDFARDFGLRDQIQRAATSVMSNLAEGYERSTTSDYLRFVVIAKGSCAEVRSQLSLAHGIGYLTDDEYAALRTEAENLSRIIGGLRLSLIKRLPS